MEKTRIAYFHLKNLKFLVYLNLKHLFFKFKVNEYKIVVFIHPRFSMDEKTLLHIIVYALNYKTKFETLFSCSLSVRPLWAIFYFSREFFLLLLYLFNYTICIFRLNFILFWIYFSKILVYNICFNRYIIIIITKITKNHLKIISNILVSSFYCIFKAKKKTSLNIYLI
jgi:hypothetical protein